MTKVVLVTNDDNLNRLVEESPESLTVMAEPARSTLDIDALIDRLVTLRTEVLVIGPDIGLDPMLDLANKLRFNHPEIEAVAYQDMPTERMVDVLRSGLRDIIKPDDGLDELIRSIESVAQAAAIGRRNTAAETKSRNNRVISVVAPKGGVGKSTLSVNLAYALAMEAPRDVVLVDLDLTGGDIAQMLQVDANSNVALAARADAANDPATLKLSLSSHESGVLVLPAPTSLLEAGDVEVSEVAELLGVLGELFAYVVVDTGPGASDIAIAAVQTCTDLVAVASPELGGVRALNRYLDALAKVGMDWPRSHFVLNRFDRRAGVGQEDIEAVLGHPIDVVIPADRHMASASNQGVPLLEIRSRGALANGYAELVDRLTVPSQAAPVTTSKGWFR